MLTQEILKANTALATLTPEQLDAIAAMSKNDETRQIADVTGKIHAAYEKDITEITGKDKPQGVKTYAWLKTEMTSLKSAAESGTALKTQITELTAERDRLKKAVESGGDKEIQTQLATVRGQLDAAKTKYATELETLTKERDAAKQQAETLELDQLWKGAAGKLQFKEGTDETVRDLVLDAAKTQLLGKYELVKTQTTAGTKISFKDKATGNIVANPERNLDPMTADELLASQPAIKALLGGQRQQGGTDSGGKTQPGPGGNQGSKLDVSAAKTQSEASQIITDTLRAQGIAKGTAKFTEAYKEAWTDEVKALPVRA